MKISTRLRLAVYVPALMALVISIALVFSYQDMARTQQTGDTVRQIRSCITELNHIVFAYTLFHEERPKQQFPEGHATLMAIIDSARVNPPDQQRLLKNIRENNEIIGDMFHQLVANHEQGSTGAAGEVPETEDRLVGLLLLRSYEADSAASTLRHLVDDGIRVTQIRTVGLIFLLLVLASVPLSIVLIRTRRHVVSSLSDLSKGAAVIGSGDLDYRIVVRTDDEIGELSRAFNRMTANLKTVTASKTEIEIASAQRQLALDAARMGWWRYDPVKRYSFWDERYKEIFGLAEYEKPNDEILATRLHPDDLPGVRTRVEAALDPVNPQPYAAEYRINLPDGSIKWIEAYGIATFEGTGNDRHATGLVGTAADITDRKASEAAIRASLSEKEVLLKEIHHRVKNNMQVISSLVDLQADEVNDPAMHSIFQDVICRIRSMAMVHEKLYQSADLARVDFADYAQSLLDYLWQAIGATASGIQLDLNLTPVLLSVNAAVPCGLILNEFFSNALKHAFKGRDSGKVTVSLCEDAKGMVRLGVRDDGVGFPAQMNLEQSRSLGLVIVKTLARQLRAEVRVKNAQGAEFTLQFER